MTNHLFSHYKATLSLGLPIAIGQVGVIVQSFADTMMVGQYSTDALAAAAFANQLFNLVTFVLVGYSYGLTPLVSGACGRGDARQASHYLKNALASNGAFWAVLMAVMGAMYACLDRFGQDPAILPLVRPYFLTMLASMGFVMLFNVLRQFADGTNDTASGMWCLVVSNAVNILGNYLLIYGKGGFPELGLLGAGISTLFSRVLMLAILAAILLLRKRYAPYRAGFRTARVQQAAMGEVHRMSYPVALQMGVETACFALSCLMAGWIGKVEMASYSVLMTISTLGYLFYYSFGAGMSIRMGTFCGTNDWTQAHRSMQAGIHLLLILATAACVVFFLGQQLLVRFFTDDVAVQTVAFTLIPPLIVYQYADAMQVGFANALRGISQVVAMMRASVVSYLLVGVPVGYLLGFPLGGGVQGLFYAFSIGLGCAAALYARSYFRFMRAHLTANL